MVQKGRLMMSLLNMLNYPIFYLNHVLPPRPSKNYTVVVAHEIVVSAQGPFWTTSQVLEESNSRVSQR